MFHGIPTLSADEENKIVHYVAIDIDDIFQPNWDSELHQIGTVKMDGTDVEALIELTHNLRLSIGEEFSFSIGYNSGYYDSTNSGDLAFIKNASYFAWFNHLPFHQHILQYSYTEIKMLLEAAGYTVMGVFGSFKGEELTWDHPRMIIFADKGIIPTGDNV